MATDEEMSGLEVPGSSARIKRQDQVPGSASAAVDLRPNRILTVIVHVATRDPNGVSRWEGDAEVKFVVPAGIDIPVFLVERMTHKIEDVVRDR